MNKPEVIKHSNLKTNIKYSSVSESAKYHHEYYKLIKNNPRYIVSHKETKEQKETEYIYPTYSKKDILKEDKNYVYYINAIWSKLTEKYMKTCIYSNKYKSYICYITVDKKIVKILLNNLT